MITSLCSLISQAPRCYICEMPRSFRIFNHPKLSSTHRWGWGRIPTTLHSCHCILPPHGVAVEDGSQTVLGTLVHFAGLPELAGHLRGSWRSPTLGTRVYSCLAWVTLKHSEQNAQSPPYLTHILGPSTQHLTALPRSPLRGPDGGIAPTLTEGTGVPREYAFQSHLPASVQYKLKPSLDSHPMLSPFACRGCQ